MADVVGGYQRPTYTSFISASYQDHRNRRPPSQEPGTDYGAAYGSAVYAPENGKVVDVKTTNSGATGRYVTIDLADGYRVRSLHLSAVLVKVGQSVKRGQQIARSGASGFDKDWGYGAHVHESLWNHHGYVFGPNGTINFEAYVGGDNDLPIVKRDQTVANQQGFLNAAQGEKLVNDGILGPATTAAFKRYQTYLKKRGWYTGKIDGIWGSGTQAAHEKRYAEWKTPNPAPTYHTATVKDLARMANTQGFQKIARLYGYSGPIDNKFGAGSQLGFQKFLDQNYGGSVGQWLRVKYGYTDHDNLWGPNMQAAAKRANAANLREL